MVVIYQCILKAFHWNTLVLHTKKSHHHLCTVLNSILFFVIFCWITANNMQLKQLHISKGSYIFKKQKSYFYGMSNIWYKSYGCANHYIYATSLYLLSILSQDFNIIIYCGISAPYHGIEVVYGLNDIYKSFIFHLICKEQLPVSQSFDAPM